jgi:hypothetical protein
MHIEVATTPDGNLDTFPGDDVNYTVDDAGRLLIHRGSDIIATYNLMGWLAVYKREGDAP